MPSSLPVSCGLAAVYVCFWRVLSTYGTQSAVHHYEWLPQREALLRHVCDTRPAPWHADMLPITAEEKEQEDKRKQKQLKQQRKQQQEQAGSGTAPQLGVKAKSKGIKIKAKNRVKLKKNKVRCGVGGALHCRLCCGATYSRLLCAAAARGATYRRRHGREGAVLPASYRWCGASRSPMPRASGRPRSCWLQSRRCTTCWWTQQSRQRRRGKSKQATPRLQGGHGDRLMPFLSYQVSPFPEARLLVTHKGHALCLQPLTAIHIAPSALHAPLLWRRLHEAPWAA